MKRLLVILAIIISASVNKSQAQEYNTSIGVGLGSDLSINFKHFLTPKGALELQGSFNVPLKGAMFSMVYQHHVYLIDGLNLYAGGGFNIGALYLKHNSTSAFAIGIDPTVGFEYTFANAPIALAIDYKPNINFTTVSQFDLVAFKIRFVW